MYLGKKKAAPRRSLVGVPACAGTDGVSGGRARRRDGPSHHGGRRSSGSS
jgi:hypothetical protein